MNKENIVRIKQLNKRIAIFIDDQEHHKRIMAELDKSIEECEDAIRELKGI